MRRRRYRTTWYCLLDGTDVKDMIEALIQWIYHLPLWTVGAILLLGLIIWSAAARFAAKDERRYMRFRIINAVLFVISVVVILWITLLSRDGSPYTGFIYMPLEFIRNAPWMEEAYRALVMNAFLFFPFGLTLPFVIGKRKGSWRRAVVWTVLMAFLFSLGMETVQFVLRIGLSEVDDILFNTLGAFIGTFAAWVGWRQGIHLISVC